MASLPLVTRPRFSYHSAHTMNDHDGASAASSQSTDRKIIIRIRRQDGPNAAGRWEEFAVPYRPNMNIISCLQYIAAHPVTTEGKQTTPVVYDSGCLEEGCGAHTLGDHG